MQTGREGEIGSCDHSPRYLVYTTIASFPPPKHYGIHCFKCDRQKGGYTTIMHCLAITWQISLIPRVLPEPGYGANGKLQHSQNETRWVYLRLLTARSKVSLENGRDSSSPTTLYVGTPGAEWLVSCNISRQQ